MAWEDINIDGYTLHYSFTNTSSGYIAAYSERWVDNMTYYYTWLVNHGFTRESAAAVLGNVSKESNSNAGLSEVGYSILGRGFGLIQWTPAQSTIVQYLTSHGFADYRTNPVSSILGQLEAINVEMDTGRLPGYDVVWIKKPGYQYSAPAFKASTDPVATLTRAYLVERERPAQILPEDRIAAAEWIYNNIDPGGGGGRYFPFTSSGKGVCGMADTEVLKAIQALLKGLGKYNGEVDGIFGPLTRKALASVGVKF